MNLNPKQQFQRDKDNVRIHAATIVQPSTQHSLSIALAQMAVDLSPEANADFVRGARLFISTWLSLSEPAEKPTENKTLRDNLEM